MTYVTHTYIIVMGKSVHNWYISAAGGEYPDNKTKLITLITFFGQLYTFLVHLSQ